jgi:hypothetical protein
VFRNDRRIAVPSSTTSTLPFPFLPRPGNIVAGIAFIAPIQPFSPNGVPVAFQPHAVLVILDDFREFS